MIKKEKILLYSLLVLASSVCMAEENGDKNDNAKSVAEIKAEIEATKAQQKKLADKLAALKAKLPQDTALHTHTELGYVATKGNTDTETFSLDTKWKKEWKKNVVKWMFDAQYGKNDGIKTKNKYFTELEYDYKFTKKFFFSYLVGYKDDEFSAYDYQFYTGPGAKYKAIKNKEHELSLEGSVLYSHDKMQPIPPATKAESNDYGSLQAKGVYTWQITKEVKFEETASYRVEVKETDNYFVYSDTEISSKISDIFSAGIGYKVDYVNLPGDKKHTDRTLLATLIMDY